MKDIAINFNHVSKKFKRGRKFYLKQALLNFFKSNQEEDFWALKDVSFKIRKGESVGIVGVNGSGKSTLLKLIAGVLTPTSGRVSVEGRIGPLIELGAGFHTELSGRDNIYLNGTILGLSKEEIDKKFNEIVEFAELQKFIDTPVKHYSSGMYMRLGFAIAININPDILLVDEILSVGDMAFQRKCLEKIQEFKNKKVSFVIVSHNIDLVRQICDRTILMDKGKIAKIGRSDNIVSDYLSKIVYSDKKNTQIRSRRWGDGKGQITSIEVVANKNIKISFKFRFKEKQENPIFGITIKSAEGTSIFVTNTSWQGIKTGVFGEKERSITFEFVNCLKEGRYTVSPAIAYSDGVRFYDWRDEMCFFDVKKVRPTIGIIDLDHEIYFH